MSHGHPCNLHCSLWSVLLVILTPEEETGLTVNLPSCALTKSGIGILVWPDSSAQDLFIRTGTCRWKGRPQPLLFPTDCIDGSVFSQRGDEGQGDHAISALEQKVSCINGLALCI